MLWRVTLSVLFFVLKGRIQIIERMSEKQQGWHGRMGLSSSRFYVKNFLWKLLTSESSRCASSSGRRKEKLHSWIEMVPAKSAVLSLGLPSILSISFFFTMMRRHCRILGHTNWLKMFSSLLMQWAVTSGYYFLLIPLLPPASSLYLCSPYLFPESSTLCSLIFYSIQSKENCVHLLWPNMLLSQSKMTSNGPRASITNIL